MRIFIAGATGVIGVPLLRLLLADGHAVAGMTRSPEKAGMLRDAGAQAVVCDVFDAPAFTTAVTEFGPDIVFHQLTDLPDEAADIARFAERNTRIRDEGTRNLLAAAAAARADRVIAQSISWELPDGRGQAATAEHERAVLQAGGIVVRYGQLWGPATYYPTAPPDPPRIHVDEAARLTLPVLAAPPGVTVVIDDRAS
ncbi:MAG: NAD-dependent epimerase/dehydratase family protein [Streptosporangiaceae bacterium]